MNVPKVFISYSHDDQEHKKWTLELAIRLRNSGIDAIIDQFELKAGDDIPHFMETYLEKSDRIIMICTEKYVEKANTGRGGVGYEKMIITSTLMNSIDESKIIPLIRQHGSAEVPNFLKTKLYINLSASDDFEFNFDELVRTIHKTPLFKKTPIGNNPFKPVEKEKSLTDIAFLHTIIKAIDFEYKEFKYPYSSNISKKLNISRSLVDIGIMKLIELGHVKWHIKNTQVELTDKGKIYAFDNKLLG